MSFNSCSLLLVASKSPKVMRMSLDFWRRGKWMGSAFQGLFNIKIQSEAMTVKEWRMTGLQGTFGFSFWDAQVRMPKWARTTRAGAYRANLGEASGKQGTRQVLFMWTLQLLRGIVQDCAEGYVRCCSYSCCGGVSPRYLKVRPQNLHPLRHPSDERPRGGVLKEFFEVPDDLVWPPRGDLRILQSHVVQLRSLWSPVPTPWLPARRDHCSNRGWGLHLWSVIFHQLPVRSRCPSMPALQEWSEVIHLGDDWILMWDKKNLLITSLLHNQTSPRHCDS